MEDGLGGEAGVLEVGELEDVGQAGVGAEEQGHAEGQEAEGCMEAGEEDEACAGDQEEAAQAEAEGQGVVDAAHVSQEEVKHEVEAHLLSL